MGNLYPIEQLIASFCKQFKDLELHYKNVAVENSYTHAFYVKNIDSESLIENWIKISNFIALNFQNKIEDDFERWNIYLFYITKNIISNEVKYQIENDTFSSRKIVITEEDNFDEINSEHITNNNLKIFNSKAFNDIGFTPDSIVWEVLEGKTLKKKKRTFEAETSLDIIIEKLKEEEYEI